MLSDFENYLRQLDRSPETVTAYVSDIKIFSLWFQSANQEDLSPNVLTPQDVKRYKYFLLQKQSAPNTINRKLISIRNFCKWARAVGIIDYDPTVGIKPIKQQELSPKWLGKKEQYAILRAVDKNIQSCKTNLQKINAIRDKAIITVLLHTGLRISELTSLKISDISMSDRKGNVEVRQGKGLKARSVPLNEVARSVLKDWFAVRPATTAEYVFAGDARGLQKRAVQAIIENIGLDAKVPFSSRQLRSSFAKNLIEEKVSIEKISKLLGHSSLNTTMLYIQPSAKDLEMATDTLAD